MTILATDNFNRADSTGLSSANWTVGPSGNGITVVAFNIASNTAAVVNNTFGGNYYSAVVWPNAQYGQGVLASPLATSADEGVGPAVRMDAVTFTGYWVQAGAGDTRLYKIVSGVFTQLGTTATASSIGDVLKLVANGTSITVTRNGTAICSTPVTDASISSGNVGVFGSSSGPNAALDNFEGGDLNAGAPSTQATELANRPRPGRGPFSKGRFYVQDTTPYTISTSITLSLTGSVSTFSPGTVGPGISTTLLGQSALFTAGIVSVAGSGNVTIALTGVAAAFGIGVFGVVNSPPLLGQPATFSSGATTPTSSPGLIGTGATLTGGALIPATSVPLTGAATPIASGTLLPLSAIAALGAQAVFSVGSLNPSMSVPLSGISRSVVTGTILASGGDAVITQVVSFLLIRRGVRKKR